MEGIGPINWFNDCFLFIVQMYTPRNCVLALKHLNFYLLYISIKNLTFCSIDADDMLSDLITAWNPGFLVFSRNLNPAGIV